MKNEWRDGTPFIPVRLRVATGERKPPSLLQGRVRQRQRKNDKARPSLLSRHTCSMGDTLVCCFSTD